jgi:hypothetical protein
MELSNDEPLIETAHELLVESLMTIYTDSNLSINDVTEAVAAINQEYELQDSYTPYDLEDALLMWLNQITTAYYNTAETEADDIPVMEDIWTGVCDGTSVAISIMSYRPDLLTIDQLCTGADLNIKEMVFNWQQVLDICDRNFNVLGSFNALSIAQNQEYSLKSNLIVFLSEVFCALVYEEENEDVDRSQIRAPTRESITSADMRRSTHSVRESLRNYSASLLQVSNNPVKPLDSSAYYDSVRANRVQRNLMGEMVCYSYEILTC